MKKALLIIATALLTGCTTIEFKEPNGTEIKVTRWLTDVHLIIDLKQGKAAYSSEPNSEAIKAIAEGITKGVVKSIAP